VQAKAQPHYFQYHSLFGLLKEGDKPPWLENLPMTLSHSLADIIQLL
jgi:hypothetical protein